MPRQLSAGPGALVGCKVIRPVAAPPAGP